MSFIQDLLKPGGGIALIPFIKMTILALLLMVMYVNVNTTRFHDFCHCRVANYYHWRLEFEA